MNERRFRVLYWIEPRGICDGGDYATPDQAHRVGAAVLSRADVSRVEIVAVETVMEPATKVDVWA